MQSYRIYELNEQGRILRGEWFQAQDDHDALARGRAMDGARHAEVWQRARRVGRVVRAARKAG